MGIIAKALTTLLFLVVYGQGYAQTSSIGTPPQSELKLTEKTTIKEERSQISFSSIFEITRSTGLYDHQDGSRSDDLSFLINPSLATHIGLFSLKATYGEDLRDVENIENGFADVLVSYSNSYPTYDWEWKQLILAPSITTIIPLSDISVKKNQLQGAVSLGLGVGIYPKSVGDIRANGLSAALAVTAGRSFHSYEEDINGQVLSQYSSNQTISVGYAWEYWTLSFDYTNRSRWTYQNNIRQSFVTVQEISYAFNDNFYTTIGHTNDAASVLEANGYESNVQIVDEDNSAIYLTIGIRI